MPGTLAVTLEPDTPCCLCHFITAQAPCPVRLGVCIPNLKELCIQSPRGTRGDWETPCPPSPHPGSAASWRGIPPPPWHSASARTQLFIASGNTPTTRLPPPFNRHRVPAHTHRAGAPCRGGSPIPAHSPIPLTCCLRALWGTSPQTPGQGAHSTPEHQPTQPAASKGSRYTSVSVPSRQPLCSKGPTPRQKDAPSAPLAPSPGRTEKPRSWTRTTTKRIYADSTQNPHSRSGMNLNDGL